MMVGLAIAGVTAFIIFRGVRSIVRFAELVVPFMALAYLFIALGVVICRFSDIPAVISLVFDSAFGLHSAAGGAAGYSVYQAMTQGIKRGLFSNEAGMGSGPNAGATATPKPHHPATQGIVSMVSVWRFYDALTQVDADKRLSAHGAVKKIKKLLLKFGKQ